MSYNLDNFTVKAIKDLVINTKDFYSDKVTTEKPNPVEILNFDTMEAKITGVAEGFELTGVLDVSNQTMKVTDINLYGEGSGYFYENLSRALDNSTGYIKVLEVWEGGDSVELYEVEDGVTKSIEL